ncbi:MAG: glycosyltransferase family 9 protein, partial [Acidocella sp.]|nr:glycosyltransferase family 9 protein [Acidocella sp.]
MRILFITSSRLGDAVISCGILEHLRQTHPDARFTIACGPIAAGLFTRLPGLERLIVFEKQKFDAHWPRLWARLATSFWDIAVDVRGSGITLFLAVSRRHILRGGRRPGRRYQQLGAAMGVSPAPLPVVWTAPEDETIAARLMGEGPVIALGPTANWDGKIWPPENFIALYHQLAAFIPGARPAI